MIDINKIKRKILIKYPYFGLITANIKFIEDYRTKTAFTDGKIIGYNEKFLSTLSENEQIFLFAHEICHIAFNHIYRSEGKNKKIWNIATDAVINANLKKDGLVLINGAINIDEAINYDAEEMYNKLLKENSNQKEGHDDHSSWNKYINKANQEKIKRLNEKTVFMQNKVERKKQLEKLKENLVSESYGIQRDNKENIRAVNNIGFSKPLIDWRLLLKETIQYDVDWSYKNAFIEDGVVIPSLEELPKAETEILLDTSGSVDEKLLRNFLRECKNIFKTSILRVGCFDTKFYGFCEIKKETDIDNMTFYGGGGTDFNVAVNSFSKRAENKIIFTDGEANMPDKGIDSIWIVFGDKKIFPKGGIVINIDKEQLRNLSMIKNKYDKIKR